MNFLKRASNATTFYRGFVVSTLVLLAACAQRVDVGTDHNWSPDGGTALVAINIDLESFAEFPVLNLTWRAYDPETLRPIEGTFYLNRDSQTAFVLLGNLAPRHRQDRFFVFEVPEGHYFLENVRYGRQTLFNNIQWITVGFYDDPQAFTATAGEIIYLGDYQVFRGIGADDTFTIKLIADPDPDPASRQELATYDAVQGRSVTDAELVPTSIVCDVPVLDDGRVISCR